MESVFLDKNLSTFCKYITQFLVYLVFLCVTFRVLLVIPWLSASGCAVMLSRLTGLAASIR